METVSVLTIREAASRLVRRREAVQLLVARGELTSATINDRPAVLDDLTFRRMKAAREAVARKIAKDRTTARTMKSRMNGSAA